MLTTLVTYPTSTEIVVITNHPERLTESLIAWNICEAQAVGPTSHLKSPLHLAWEHRTLMEAAINSGVKANEPVLNNVTMMHHTCLRQIHDFHVPGGRHFGELAYFGVMGAGH